MNKIYLITLKCIFLGICIFLKLFNERKMEYIKKENTNPESSFAQIFQSVKFRDTP